MTLEERARKIYADLFKGGSIALILKEIKVAVTDEAMGERKRCVKKLILDAEAYERGWEAQGGQNCAAACAKALRVAAAELDGSSIGLDIETYKASKEAQKLGDKRVPLE